MENISKYQAIINNIKQNLINELADTLINDDIWTGLLKEIQNELDETFACIDLCTEDGHTYIEIFGPSYENDGITDCIYKKYPICFDYENYSDVKEKFDTHKEDIEKQLNTVNSFIERITNIKKDLEIQLATYK